MRISVAQRSTVWAVLAGISYILCFPRYDLPLLSLLFMPGLLFSIHSLTTRKQAIGLGFLLSAMIAWGGFHWIIYVAQYFGGLSFPLALGLLCLFCLVAAPQLVAFFFVGHWLRFKIEKQPLFLRPLFWAALYTGLEFLACFLKIFPESIGNTMIRWIPLAQAASLGGVSLLSFLPLWLGASVYYWKKSGRAGLPSLACSAVLILALFLWGKSEKTRIENRPSELLRVGLVQHNLEEVEKLAERIGIKQAISQTVAKLLEHNRALAPLKPDLIIWPETSYPMAYPTEPVRAANKFAYGYANLVKDQTAKLRIPLLFGAYENDGEKDYNSAVILGADGNVEATYKKQVLLIFGEYIPFTDLFPSIKDLNPQMGDFGRGPGAFPTNFIWKGKALPLGINICYEAILPTYMRPYAQRGARLFVNLTKDSWFGDTFEPWQHFQLSILRSVEHHIPMVRSTNTGLSGLVTATGEVQLISDPYHEAVKVLEVAVPLSPSPTLYTRFGEWFALLCLFFSFCLGLRAYRN
jgi:apolipoprotein N-acyltransferase